STCLHYLFFRLFFRRGGSSCVTQLIFHRQCLQLWHSFHTTRHNDCVELAFFKVGIRHCQYRLLLTLLPHFQRDFLRRIHIHVVCVLLEVHARKQLLISFFIDDVNLT